MAKYADLNPYDILSDDSSFYGDEHETQPLKQEASAYDPEPYWTRTHPSQLSTLQSKIQQENKQKQAIAASIKSEDTNDTKMSLTPMDTDMDMDIDTDTPKILPRNKPAPNETPSTFLSRLPPSSTKESSIGPWIYIQRPLALQHKEDLASFRRQGLEALHDFQNTEAELRFENDQKGGSKIALSQKVKPLQRELEGRIFELARETNVITGKWMLFITPDRIDRYWASIAEATMNGHLGIAAKVATKPNDGEFAGSAAGNGNNFWNSKARLIAVYTRDYEDTADIKRVLRKLVELGLVKREERPIYYKRDALTHLEIMSKNRYGMRATAFSSADLLKGMM